MYCSEMLITHKFYLFQNSVLPNSPEEQSFVVEYTIFEVKLISESFAFDVHK